MIYACNPIYVFEIKLYATHPAIMPKEERNKTLKVYMMQGDPYAAAVFKK